MGVQLAQPGLAPGQVVGFLARRLQQELPGRLGSGDERLAVIQGLGGHLAGVVDPHEGGRRAPVAFGKAVRGLPRGGVARRCVRPGRGRRRSGDGARSVSGSEQGAQRPVGGAQQAVEGMCRGFHAPAL
jgi:hypothetical protein